MLEAGDRARRDAGKPCPDRFASASVARSSRCSVSSIARDVNRRSPLPSLPSATWRSHDGGRATGHKDARRSDSGHRLVPDIDKHLLKDGRPETCRFGRLHKMSAKDLGDPVMAVDAGARRRRMLATRLPCGTRFQLENRTHFDSGLDGPIDGRSYRASNFIFLNQFNRMPIRFRIGSTLPRKIRHIIGPTEVAGPAQNV